MNYEYATLVETGSIKPGIADATSDEVSQSIITSFGGLVNKVSKALDTLSGGGWEIISHHILRLDRHLVATFLVRRPKEK